jgi:hypothetical protein
VHDSALATGHTNALWTLVPIVSTTGDAARSLVVTTGETPTAQVWGVQGILWLTM